MPVSLTAVTSERATAQIPIGSDILNVTYNPAAYTPKFEASLKEDEESTYQSGVAVKMVRALVVAWDLMDGETPVPLTEEALSALPVKFLIAVIQGVTKSFNPNPPSSASSGSFS